MHFFDPDSKENYLNGFISAEVHAPAEEEANAAEEDFE